MTTPAPSPRRIRYAVHGGVPPVDLAADVAEGGAFRVEVMTGNSLAQPPVPRFGIFEGRFPPPLFGAFTRWATSAEAMPGGQVNAPGTLARLMSLDGADPHLVNAPAGEFANLEQELSKAFIAALDRPVSAVEVEPGRGNDAATGSLVIRAIGREPFPLILFADDGAGFWARLWLDDPKSPGARVYVPHDTIAALAKSGAIGEGTVQLAPGAEIALPLPPLPEGGASGGFTFWRAGTGPERRMVNGSWWLPAG